MGEIFKESTEFKVTKFFIGQLKELQYEIYKKYITPIAPGETRWNSIYEMYLSLLKTQQALQVSIFYLIIIKLFLKRSIKKNLLF